MEAIAGERATLTRMSSIDLRRLRLRPGEVRQERVDVELDPFVLGGQRYEGSPRVRSRRRPDHAGVGRDGVRPAARRRTSPAPACAASGTRTSTSRRRRASSTTRPRRPPTSSARTMSSTTGSRSGRGRGTRSRSPFPSRSSAGTTAPGLCPVCGKDLNAEPHEHAERELDPRWAAARAAPRPALKLDGHGRGRSRPCPPVDRGTGPGDLLAPRRPHLDEPVGRDPGEGGRRSGTPSRRTARDPACAAGRCRAAGAGTSPSRPSSSRALRRS